MSYGTIKVDTITFTDNSVDKSVSLSGLIQNPTFTGNITVTGTISGDVIRGGTTVSGATVTGTTANFVSGVFTTQISGATVTGTTASFTSGVFTNISGTTATITSGIIASGTAAAPSLAILADLDTGLFSPGANQLAVATNGVGRLFVDSTGKVGIGSPSSLNSFEINTAGTPLSVNSTNGGQNKIILRTNGAAEGYFGTTSTALLTASDGSGSERLRITSAGLVGIGTSSPNVTLDIESSSGTAVKIRLASNTSNRALCFSNVAETIGWTVGNGIIAPARQFVVYDNEAGAARLLIDSSGRVGIGTTNSVGKLTVATSSTDPSAALSSWSDGYLVIAPGGTTTSGGVGLSFNTSSNVGGISCATPGSAWRDLIYKASAHRFELGGIEAARIDSSGRLLVGTSSSITNLYRSFNGAAPPVQIETATDNYNAGVSALNYSASGFPPMATLGMSRSSTKGTNTVVVNGDELGYLQFVGADGTNFRTAAWIRGEVDGTPGNDDMPGRLVFSTTADGASTPTERLRITSAGLVGIGTSTPGSKLTIDANVAGYNVPLDVRNSGSSHPYLGVAQTFSVNTGSVVEPVGRILATSSSWTYGTFGSNKFTIEGMKPGGIDIRSNIDAPITFSTGGTQDFSVERLRIDSSGRLLVGTSSASAMDSSSQFGSATPRQTIFENTATGGAAFVNVQGEMNGSAATRIAGINFALSTQTTITESAKSASLYVTATDAFANTPSLFIAVGNDNAISIPTSGIANFIKGLTIPTGKAIGGAGIINMSGSSGHELNNIASSLCLTTDSAADGSIIVFDRSGVGQGSISVTTGTVSYNQFLGSHWAALTDWSRPNIKLGTILETINELTDWKYVAIEVEGKQKKICYNGTAAPDDMVSVEYEGKTYEGIVELEDNSKFNKAVKVKVNDTAASKAVYGVFVGWNTDGNFDGGIWNDMYVGAVGNYVIRMAAGQEPEIGDLVEADGTGCAVVQADDIIRTKTVAKITSTIPQVAYDDGSFIVTCVLYCG
jgi:hypothetical protein